MSSPKSTHVDVSSDGGRRHCGFWLIFTHPALQLTATATPEQSWSFEKFISYHTVSHFKCMSSTKPFEKVEHLELVSRFFFSAFP